MKQSDFWFVTFLLVVALFFGGYFLIRVPKEEVSDQLDMNSEATASAVTIERFRPDSGPVSGGTEILIEGANLSENLEIVFGNRLATDKRFMQGALIVKTPEATASGPVEVWVYAGQKMIKAGKYLYHANPVE